MGRRRWVSKCTSGICRVDSELVQWREQPTLDCPRCGEHENARHVWTHQEPAVFFVWVLLMSTFSKWLELVHTAKDMTCSIIQRLIEWRSSEPFSRAQSNMPGLLQAINAQDRIGWLAFLEGCIAVKWAGVQEAHFLWLSGQNTGKQWAASLVVKLGALLLVDSVHCGKKREKW